MITKQFVSKTGKFHFDWTNQSFHINNWLFANILKAKHKMWLTGIYHGADWHRFGHSGTVSQSLAPYQWTTDVSWKPLWIFRQLWQAKTELATGGSRRSHWRGPTASSAKNLEQNCELGGRGHAPWEIFFWIMQNAANWAIFIIFVRPLGGGHGPPLEPPVALVT